MSDLRSRIGKRTRYPPQDGIKKSPVNRRTSSSLGHHHSNPPKYATFKSKPYFSGGSPPRVIKSEQSSSSLLSRLDPLPADGPSKSRGNLVSLIDRAIGIKEEYPSRGAWSMDKPVHPDSPRMPVYENGSFVVSQNFNWLFSRWSTFHQFAILCALLST